MESIEIIKNPEMAKAATIMSKNLAYAWAERELLFWKELSKKLQLYIEQKKDWILKQQIFYKEDDENIIDSDNEIIKWIVNLNKKDLRGVYFEKNDFKFYIYIFNGGSFEYYIEKEKKVEEFGKLVGINKPVRGIPNERYTTTKYNYNFSKDYDEPTYDIFDNNKLDEIVENIYNEIKSYMDIIVKELN